MDLDLFSSTAGWETTKKISRKTPKKRKNGAKQKKENKYFSTPAAGSGGKNDVDLYFVLTHSRMGNKKLDLQKKSFFSDPPPERKTPSRDGVFFPRLLPLYFR